MTARSFGEHWNPSQLNETCTKHIDQLTIRIRQGDTEFVADPARWDVWQMQRDSLTASLRESVALSEFLRQLSRVPTQSTHVVASNWNSLAEILPHAGDVSRFEQQFRGSEIRPVNFEAPAEVR